MLKGAVALVSPWVQPPVVAPSALAGRVGCGSSVCMGAGVVTVSAGVRAVVVLVWAQARVPAQTLSLVRVPSVLAQYGLH